MIKKNVTARAFEFQAWLAYSLNRTMSRLWPFVFLLALSLPVNAYVLDNGGGVSWSNSYGSISAYPANLTDMLDYQYVNVTSQIPGTWLLDFAFQFDDAKTMRPTNAWTWQNNVAHEIPSFGPVLAPMAFCDTLSFGAINSTHGWCMNSTGQNASFYCPSPRVVVQDAGTATCYVNRTEVNGTTVNYYPDWVPVNDRFYKRDYAGKTFYIIENVSFSQGQMRQLKLELNIAPGAKGKYGLRIKRSAEGWIEAIQGTSMSVYLDPWYDTNWNYQIQLPISCPAPGCSDAIAFPLSLNNATQVCKMKSGGADLRYVVNCSGVNTVRNLWVRNFTDCVNVSLFLNYTNDTTCSHHIYYNNSAASTVSSPYGVFKLFDDFDDTSFNLTSWAVFDHNPYELGNGWAEMHYDGADTNKYIYTAAAGSTKVQGNWTMYEEIRLRTTTGKGAGFATTWGGGNPGNGYEWGALGWPTTRSANALVNYTSFGTWPGNQSMITDLNTNVLYRFVKVNGSSGKFNISRLNITVESLSNESWWSLNQTINRTYDDAVFVTDCAGAAGSNISVFWIGFTDGVSTPYLTPGAGIMEEAQPAGVTFGVSQVRLCQGTTCSLFTTLYANSTAIWNASGNCSGTSTSTPFYTGNFSFWINGIAQSDVSNISTYNWVENQTNYSTQLVNYPTVKGETLMVSLVCFNSTNSTNLTTPGANSTAYTVNNTAPIVTVPSITWDTSYPNANSILTCNNGTYSDVVDGDLMNYTWNGYYTWYRNGTLLAGYNNQTLNISYLTAVQGGENFSCFWTVNDTGYQPLTGTNGSTNITLGGGMPVTDCITINVPGRYTITQDILGVNPADYCITIASSNVELDGNFHQIRAFGKSDDDYIAIWIYNAGTRQSGLNFTNMTLIGWNNPIIGLNVDNVSFKNLNISDNQSANPPPDIAACESYYGCITMWTSNNSYYENINCTQSHVCGKGLIINAPGWAASPWTNSNITMKNIKINSTNQSGIWIENTTNVFIQDVNITDSNVSTIMFNRVNNFSIKNINISYITNLIGTGTTSEKAVMLFNQSNGTVGNFFFSASQASIKVIYLKGNSRVVIENSTIITSGLGNATFNVSDNSVLNMTNITYTCGNCFDASHPNAGLYGANITLWQPVWVRVRTAAGLPLANAIVNITSNMSIVGNVAFIVMQNNLTSALGYTGIYNATEMILNNTRSWFMNNHSVNVSLAGYQANDSSYNLTNGTQLITVLLSPTPAVVPPGGGVVPGGGFPGLGNWLVNVPGLINLPAWQASFNSFITTKLYGIDGGLWLLLLGLVIIVLDIERTKQKNKTKSGHTPRTGQFSWFSVAIVFGMVYVAVVWLGVI